MKPIRTTAAGWYYGWNVVAAAFAGQAVAIGATSAAYGVYVLPLSAHLHATRFATTLGYALLLVGTGLASPVVAAVIARVSIRRTMSIGLIGLAAGFALLSISTDIREVILLYALIIGPAAALSGPLPGSTLAVNWFTTHRGRALGITTLSVTVGALVFPPLAAVFISRWGWRSSYIALAVAALVSLLPIGLIVKDRPEETTDEAGRAGEGKAARAVNEEPIRALKTNMQVLREGSFWVIALAAGLGECVAFAVMVNVVPIAIDRGCTSVEAAYLISVFTGGLMAGKLLIGAAGDRFRPPPLWVASLALAATGTVTLAYASSFASLFCAAALAGIGSGGYHPLMGLSIASSFPRAAFSKVMGLVLPVVYLISAPGAPLAGLLYDQLRSYIVALWIFVALLLAGAAIMGLYGESARMTPSRSW